jgi:lantibiotic modifying enzyme
MKQQQSVDTLSMSQARIVATSRDESDCTKAEIVLFLLDLARMTRDSSLLEVATFAASHLTEDSSRRMAHPGDPGPSLVHSLSRTAFALAEAWKITHDVRYREAGLRVIRYLSGIASTPLTADPEGTKL